MGEDFQHFLTFWFDGFINGLESADKTSQEAILRACGKGCAASYTAQVFRDTRRQSTTLETFLTNLSLRFPEARYELISPRAIRVTYARCACDLAQRGFVHSPILCRCSAYNLQANFEQALKVPAEVSLHSSIARGADTCDFVVSFQDDLSRSF